MRTSYNQITGQSLERLAALSDGIFAVAMTLLVLDLHVPASEVIHSQGQLWHTLAEAVPQLVSYIMSFITLAIFWNGQQAHCRQPQARCAAGNHGYDGRINVHQNAPQKSKPWGFAPCSHTRAARPGPP